MKPKTLAALAIATGLVVSSGILALAATLMPSSAAPRPLQPVSADVTRTEPSTTIVTDTVDVFDLPSSDSSESTASDDSADDPEESSPPATAPAPTLSSSSSSFSENEHESEDSSSGSESEHGADD